MKIYEFLLETNVMISHGEIYAGKELSEKILYYVYFEKNNKKGKDYINCLLEREDVKKSEKLKELIVSYKERAKNKM